MSRLHIAIDAHRLVCEPMTSGATFLGALVSEWLQYPEPPILSLLVPWRPAPGSSRWTLLDNDQLRVVCPQRRVSPASSYRAQVSWQQVTIPALLKSIRPDVYFSPFHLTPLRPFGLPMVTTIHDLCCLMEPFSRWSLLPRAELWSACLRANRLICISEFTCSMLKQWAPRASQRAAVVHNGIDGSTLPLAEARDRVRGLCPDLEPSKYLFWIGHPCARKNPELLFEIFGRHHRAFPDHKFVIVAPDRSHEQLKNLGERNGVAPAMRLFSGLEDAARDSLYRCALALIFPSRCEGFGYPVLEAMYQGCPAFAYADGPAREMISGILPMAEALTLEAFTTAMEKYLSIPEVDREALKSRLVGEALRFSSRMTAHKTMRILREAAGWPEEQQSCPIS